MKYIICIPRKRHMFQEIHSSSVPVPIHFKVEDGDFVFLNSFWLGTVKTVLEILPVSSRTQMLQKLPRKLTGFPIVLKEMYFIFRIIFKLCLGGAGTRTERKVGK